MEILFLIIFFVIGTVLGSFYNVVGVRLPLKQSLLFPASHCVKCQHKLTVFEVIPILSYIFLRGSCRKCQEKIGLFHVVIELGTGILFMLAYWQFSLSWELLIAILFISLLAIITVSDICYMVIQNRILVIFGIALAVFCIALQNRPILESLMSMFFSSVLLTIISLLSKGGIGGGDIKLYLIIGFVLGFQNTFISLFLASLIGLIAALFLKKGFGSYIPFAPSIALGSMFAYFFGDTIALYYSYFLF